jgi:hypothetical protein
MRVLARCVLVVGLACGRPPPETPAVEIVNVPPPASAKTADLPIAAPEARALDGDPNPRGATLNPEAVFRDPEPPDEWEQCAGFVNTSQDDIANTFFDNCIGATRLRVRVFSGRGELEEDVFVTNIVPGDGWPRFGYLGSAGTIVKNKFWGTLDGGAASVLFTDLGGRDACGQNVAPDGPTLGSGHAEKAIIAPGNKGYDEYRVSCGKQSLPNRRIAIYR